MSNKSNVLNMKNIRNIFLAGLVLVTTVSVNAQSNSNRLSLGVGALYEKGFDVTLAVEHETQNHNAW